MLGWSPRLGGPCEDLGAVSAGTTGGTLVTASATLNALGAWTLIGTATQDWHWLGATMLPSSDNTDFMVDIGIDDGAGNKWVVAASLHASANSAWSGGGSYVLPIRIPDGSAFYARTSANVVSATIEVILQGGQPWLWGAPGFSRAVALFTPATSRGLSLDPTVANTKSAWAQSVAASTGRVGGLFLTIGTGGTVARTAAAWLIDVGIGAAGSEQVLIPNLAVNAEATGLTPWPQRFGPFPCDVPTGTRFALRSQCTVTTAGVRTLDASLHGLVV